jgi:hypothetical protein
MLSEVGLVFRHLFHLRDAAVVRSEYGLRKLEELKLRLNRPVVRRMARHVCVRRALSRAELNPSMR